MSLTSDLTSLYTFLKTTGILGGNRVSTYNFNDWLIALSHPDAGMYDLSYSGVGEISISWLNERTTHDISVDGSTFVLKSPGNNALVTLSIQQSCDINKWLTSLAATVMSSDAKRWAMINMTMRNSVDNTTYSGTGGSLLKIPDLGFQAQGQRVSWPIYFADLSPTAGTSIVSTIGTIENLVSSVF